MRSTHEIELLKILLESAHKQAELFWTRNGALLGLNVAALGAVIAKLSNGPIAHSKWMFVAGTWGGALLSFAWLHVIRWSRYYNHTFVSDAKRLVHSVGNEDLADAFKYSLLLVGGHSHEASGKKSLWHDVFSKPESATWWMYPLALGMLLAWVGAGLHLMLT